MAYSKQDLEKAIHEYHAGSHTSIRAVAKLYNIPFSTLRDRVNGNHARKNRRRLLQVTRELDVGKILAHSRTMVSSNERIFLLERALKRAGNRIDFQTSQIAQKDIQLEAREAQIALLAQRKRCNIRMDSNSKVLNINQYKKIQDGSTQYPQDTLMLQDCENASNWAFSYNPRPVQFSMMSCLNTFQV